MNMRQQNGIDLAEPRIVGTAHGATGVVVERDGVRGLSLLTIEAAAD